VFSTSKDHRQGETAMAGCILVDNEKIQVINRSPKYKNKYVHRRTSVSLENLTPKEVSICLFFIQTTIINRNYFSFFERWRSVEE
jgi:hypothetical protein